MKKAFLQGCFLYSLLGAGCAVCMEETTELEVFAPYRVAVHPYQVQNQVQKREPNMLYLVRHFAQLPTSCIPCRWQDLETVDTRIEQALAPCGAEDLVVLDIDDTCLETEDPTFQTRYLYGQDPASIRYRVLFDLFESAERKSLDCIEFLSRRIAVQKRRLIEPCFASLVQELQNRGTPVIALSSFSAGAFGCIAQLEEHRYQELKAAGIDLERVVPKIDDRMLNEQFYHDTWRREHVGAVALYRNILASSHQLKGFVLNRYIACLQSKPRRVYFFDDFFENHVSVLMALKLVGIPLSSFLYTGARELLPCSTLDLSVAEKQLNYMREQREYISYTDMHRRMQDAMRQKSLGTNKTVGAVLTPATGEPDDAHAAVEMCSLLACLRTMKKEQAPSTSDNALYELDTWPDDTGNPVLDWHIDCATIPEEDEAYVSTAPGMV